MANQLLRKSETKKSIMYFEQVINSSLDGKFRITRILFLKGKWICQPSRGVDRNLQAIKTSVCNVQLLQNYFKKIEYLI